MNTLPNKILKDKDIREELFEFLEYNFGKVRILEEKTMGHSRADVVMITSDSIYGIEIKSDVDTYVRLDRQVKDYNKYFDYNYVVIGTSHAAHIREHIPDYWGIITAEKTEEGLDFYEFRKPQVNPKMDWKKKMAIMWRPELAHIQELNALPKYKNKSKEFVVDMLLNKVPEKTLRIQMCEELFERDYSLIAETIANYRNKPKRISNVRAIKKAIRKKRKLN